MKTIKEHLETLPEPYRTQALKNMYYEDNTKHQSIALIRAFSWEDSPEGFDYWDGLFERLKEETRC